ncbi:hypothetical protein JH06_2663 [Blastocystis sp. subtype 4]|uniref:hypothetical protein n=1 Tax=Blastocystis sp. subtype 4 TaxID=944170 RepID=UPI000711A6E9|nr:hypothetical protein JH06_2663 [Blastocystis sp. subtype 4]KNB43520.1 hypothetical protein JH06_2663 [Blastocystis sp. subtype 4]|eukprot:XP_014526963.1 hypothetical protein JH06_2663 [Blastocystis sp. subtype 4]
MCVKDLIALLQSDSSLCSVLLSTLENLRLTEQQFSDHLSIFTGALTSVSLDDLPLVLRFLLRVCPLTNAGKSGSECNQVIGVIRQSCDPSKWASSNKERDDVKNRGFFSRTSCIRRITELLPTASGNWKSVYQSKNGGKL